MQGKHVISVIWQLWAHVLKSGLIYRPAGLAGSILEAASPASPCERPSGLGHRPAGLACGRLGSRPAGLAASPHAKKHAQIHMLC